MYQFANDFLYDKATFVSTIVVVFIVFAAVVPVIAIIFKMNNGHR
jgi:hypothetical protein